MEEKIVIVLICLLFYVYFLFFNRIPIVCTPLSTIDNTSFKYNNVSISSENLVSSPSDWAIILYGGIRTYEHTRNTIITNIKNAADPPMDIISYTFFNKTIMSERKGFNLLKSDSIFISTRDFIQQTTTKTDVIQTIDRYDDQYTLIKMLLGIEYKRNHTYKYIIFMRPDLYFSETFNITNIKEILNKGEHLLLNPTCCRFFGYCDRFSIAKRDDMVKMLENKNWHKSTTRIPGYERAFKLRTLQSNLTAIDTDTTGYSFSTLRSYEIHLMCNNKTHKPGFWDYICFKPWANQRPRKLVQEFLVKNKTQICKPQYNYH